MVPRELVHFVYPGFRWVSVIPEPVGRWIERLLCCSAVVRRIGFRVARNPEVVELELKDLFLVYIYLQLKTKSRRLFRD